jgi:hypothetical protein
MLTIIITRITVAICILTVTVLLSLLLEPLSLLYDKVEAATTSIVINGEGRGILTCSNDERRDAYIIFRATSSPSTSSSGIAGEWDISSNNIFKSGSIINGNIIVTSGHFRLTGTETSDNICSDDTSSRITISGKCTNDEIVTFRNNARERGTFTLADCTIR